MIFIKIVICGPLQCGKSSYIKYIDNKALNVEARGIKNECITVGLDLGSIKLNGFDIFLFGTPGLLRFSVMRDVVVEGADGIIFMFDASNKSSDADAITILNQIRKIIAPNTPIIYLANKQDIQGARSAEQIKIDNNLHDFEIIPTSVKTGLNIMESLKNIVNKVYNRYKELLEMMKDYENDIRGLAEKLHYNKQQIRDFLNNLEIKRFIEIDRIKKTYRVKGGLKNLI
ncbi:MAG: GTP-binding protein [Promethearchaeota archaeon]